MTFSGSGDFIVVRCVQIQATLREQEITLAGPDRRNTSEMALLTYRLLTRLPLGATLMGFSIMALAEPDFSGIWILQGRAAEGALVLTGEGERIQAAYDLLEDDPSLKCVPASISRVWANPNVRIGIEQSATNVLISYEFFDLRRDIPLGDASAMSATPSTRNVSGQYFKEMGSSYARYEGDRLVIDTGNHGPGYIRTSRGVPQSGHSVATEELWLDGETLRMTLTYVDDTLFEIPLILDHTFIRTDDATVPLYECTDADYDWFEQLNAPKQEDSQ